MNKLGKTLAVTALGLVASASGGMAEDFRMLTAWGPNHSGTENMAYGYIDLVETMSDGAISITPNGPEVVPAGQQLQPVAAGVFDIIYTHGLYHTGETGIGAALDAVEGDIDRRRETGVWDWVDSHYQETQGLKILSIPTATTGFRFYLNEPFDDANHLNGQTIRALPSYNAIIAALGATGVVIPFGELYSAAESGVIDGMVWTSVGAVGFNFHEVSPHIADPTFGTVSYLIMMDLDRWEALNQETQALLLEAGYQLELDTVEVFNRLLVEETDQMLADGAQMTSIGMSQEEANALFAEGAMAVAVSASGETGKEFRDFVTANDM